MTPNKSNSSENVSLKFQYKGVSVKRDINILQLHK